MKRLAAAIVGLVIATPAWAHHPMGGETPSNVAEGLLSGIGHPILGLDHLAFVLAVGIAAALAGRRFVLPLAFVAATVAGTLVHLAAIGLPAAEWVIAASVAAIGLALASGRDLATPPWAVLFAVAGLFHGFAYGEAVFGAEATPVLAYLAGFGLTQFTIAVAAGFAVTGGVSRRVAGGMVAGAGLLIVGEKTIELLFA